MEAFWAVKESERQASGLDAFGAIYRNLEACSALPESTEQGEREIGRSLPPFGSDVGNAGIIRKKHTRFGRVWRRALRFGGNRGSGVIER